MSEHHEFSFSTWWKRMRSVLQVDAWPIRRKYLSLLLLFIFLPLLLMGFWLMALFTNQMTAGSVDDHLVFMNELSGNIKKRSSQHALTAATILNDEVLLEEVDALLDEKDTSEYLQRQQQIERKIENYFHYSEDFLALVFYYPDRQSFYYRYPSRFTTEEMMSRVWFRNFVQEAPPNSLEAVTDDEQIIQMNTMQECPVLALAGVPDSYKTQSPVLLYFAFKAPSLNRYNKAGVAQDWQLSLYTSDNKRLPEQDANALTDYAVENDRTEDMAIKTVSWEGQKYICSIYNLPQLRCKLIGTLPLQQIREQVNKAVIPVFLTFLAAVGLLLYLHSLITKREVVTPIWRMQEAFAKVAKADFTTRVIPTSNQEFRSMSDSFLTMSDELQVLLHRIEEHEKKKSALEIEVLQYQINPHFLLNTLSSMRQMAEFSGADHVAEMGKNLASLLQGTLRNPGNEQTVAEAFKLLQDYEGIMRPRFAGRFRITYTIEDGAEQAAVLPMLFQPLLENCFYHGFRDVFTLLEVEIKAYHKDGHLLVQVCDNGPGMDESQMEKLREVNTSPPDALSRIGLANVHRRIQLHYGAGFGLTFQNRAEGGLEVRVVLPWRILPAAGEISEETDGE